MNALKITSHIIPASSIRRLYGNNGGQLLIAVNSYDPIEGPGFEKETSCEKTTIIFAAANGFHKEIYEPVINGLNEKRERWNGGTMWALDGSNQGDSAVANQDILPDSYNWSDLSRDILQVIDYFNIKGPIVGVGHSLGGCAILMAEILRPGTFSSLVAIDPVLYPYKSKEFAISSFQLALKRKDTWQNRDAAKESFLKHNFFKSWDPEVLNIHIKYGLRDLPSGEVTLKCPKIQEHYTFTHDSDTLIETFQRLHEIQCPVLFITGKKSTTINPLDLALFKASRCKHGDLIILDTGHLVVMEKPKETGMSITGSDLSRVIFYTFSLQFLLTFENKPIAKEILYFICRQQSKESCEKNSSVCDGIIRNAIYEEGNNEKGKNKQIMESKL
ncbi:12422_t:CDS:2 [Acaulospora morrowiae]|uniref:12422_t:CDS:1 n=1 Tax=Acaulospora morrowiae TaxID=94023 RepID=A0A9N9DL92_9GLOM|nr:12422_t:CDS:2 [Acaulospora morrowiae]